MWLRKVPITAMFSIFLLLNSLAQEALSLEQCISIALERNIDLAHKAVELEIKDRDWMIAKKNRLPSISGYTNLYSNFGYSQDIFGTIRRNDNLNSSMGVTAEIMIYNYGTLKNNIRKASIDKEIVNIDRQVVEWELIVHVTKTYFEVLLEETLVMTRDSAVVNAYELLNRSKKTNAVGTTSLTDLYEAGANYAREQQQLEIAKSNWKRARLKLSQLLMLDNEEELIISPVFIDNSSFGIADLAKKTVLADVFSHHPRLARYNALVDGLKIEHKLIKAQMYPILKGSSSLGSTYFNPLRMSEKNVFFRQTKDNFAQQVALTVQVPIFNKGHSRLKMNQLKLREKQINLEYEKDKQVVKEDIELIYLDFLSNNKQYISAGEVLKQTKQAMQHTYKSYLAGRSSIYDYNNSRQNYIQAQNEVTRTAFSMLFSYKMLKFQTTGSYED